MIHLGLAGYPLEHSLSPALHKAALRASGLQGSYSLFPIQPGDEVALYRLVECIRTGELEGLNVTIPHKQVVMGFLDELTPAAAEVGAVNTIYRKDGRVFGDNTDSPGFLTDLQAFSPDPRSAIILGAGGAARAVTHALRSIGCAVTVVARRVAQARELARRFAGVKSMELDMEAMLEAKTELLVNTTPVGMFPDVDHCPWPEDLRLPENAVVYDLIYNPPETSLVRRARTAGLRSITGLGMLVEQAALAFELWTGYKVRREALIGSIRYIAR
jgi:shikimate dehydrogenase